MNFELFNAAGTNCFLLVGTNLVAVPPGVSSYVVTFPQSVVVQGTNWVFSLTPGCSRLSASVQLDAEPIQSCYPPAVGVFSVALCLVCVPLALARFYWRGSRAVVGDSA